ncbi:MAG: chromosomal replication initiator protein DnaA [Firmicutes bacterium]|nr:chromosomal replication initiator protein DnaA [Bacillota bacterium]
MDIEKIWRGAQKKIQDRVSAVSFDLWIATLTPEEFRDGEFVLAATSSNARDQAYKDIHFPHIEAEIRDAAPIVEKIVIIDAIEKEQRDAAKNPPQKNLENEITPPSYSAGFIVPNPTKTFDTFIVGKSNEYVAAAAEAVARAPGKRINPLFIYGNSGLGKTHLLHAIANHIRNEQPHLKIAFATCDKFTTDYVNAMRFKSIPVAQLRENYRNVDVLLLDDIHDIENRTGTQEEFFNTFNDLFQNGKQIILTSDRHADKFTTLEERMRSRFKSGLIQDMTAPDVEMRMAILQKKASLENYRLDTDVVQYLAEKAFKRNMNIRDMEGILFKVIFYAGLKNRETPTILDCREALQEQEEDVKSQTTSETIIDNVCKYFHVKKDDLISKKRNREFAEPRMFAIYLISEFLNIPLVNIGQLFGGRDHTTILHSRNKITNQLTKDTRTKRIVEDLTKLVIND